MRTIRLFGAIISLSMRRELAFRTQLLFQLLLTLLEVSASVLTLEIVYHYTSTLAGWSRGESIVLLGTFQIMSGFLSAFIEPALRWFNSQVKNGKLDSLLLQPVPAILMASLGTCAPLELANVVLGGVLVCNGLQEVGTIPAIWNIASWLIMLSAGSIITWATRVLLASLAFWTPSIDPDIFFGALWQFGRYPTSIYRQPLRFTLTYLLPVTFIATIPTRMLLHKPDPLEMAAGIAIAICSIIVTRLVWNAGLRRYRGTTG